MKLLELRKNVRSRLSKIGNMATRESDWIIEHVLECDKTFLLTNSDKDISSEDQSKIYNFVDRRLIGEPLQYILGSEIFMGLKFKVSPDVLIPRFDTEILINRVFELINIYSSNSKKCRILDIGTGSGIIPISIAKHFTNVEIIGVDISDKALEVAIINSKNHGVNKRIKWIKSDIFDVFSNDCNLKNEGLNKDIKFDIIISNPPYIPTDDIENLQIELQFEPKIALDGGKDGYDFYRNIIANSPKFLKRGGWLVMETGHDQAQRVADIMATQNTNFESVNEELRDLLKLRFTDISLYKDTQYINRVVCGSLC